MEDAYKLQLHLLLLILTCGSCESICDITTRIIDIANSYKTRQDDVVTRELNDVKGDLLNFLKSQDFVTSSLKGKAIDDLLEPINLRLDQISVFVNEISVLKKVLPRLKSRYRTLPRNHDARVTGDEVIELVNAYLQQYNTLTWQHKRDGIDNITTSTNSWKSAITKGLKAPPCRCVKNTLTALNLLMKDFDKSVIKLAQTFSQTESLFKTIIQKANVVRRDFPCGSKRADVPVSTPRTKVTTPGSDNLCVPACLHGSCEELEHGEYVCKCKTGYNGADCSQSDPCGCGEGGVCDCETRPCRCKCFPMYSGTKCKTILPLDKNGCSIRDEMHTNKFWKNTNMTHYQTYDRARYYFLGRCLYVLTEPKDEVEPKFEIALRQKLHVNEGKNHTWPEYIVLHVNGKYIVIGQETDNGKNDVQIDEKAITIPSVHSLGIVQGHALKVKVKILQGGDVQVEIVPYGIGITFDGKSVASVLLNKYWNNKVRGMCGDHDGKMYDDYVTREGYVVRRRDDKKGILIGNSWKKTDKVQYDPDSNTCRNIPLPAAPSLSELKRWDRGLYDKATKTCSGFCGSKTSYKFRKCVSDFFFSEDVVSSC